jgi:uncharacterized protein (TIGR04255 family)
MIRLMAKRKYKTPAVREAIFEAKFNYDSFDSAVPGQIFERIKENYPDKEDIKHELVFFERDRTNPPTTTPLIQAPLMRARRKDNSELLQFGPGIALANRFKYSTWDEFVPTIETIVKAYIDSAHPQTITRVGMRYVNSFLTPEETIIPDYFKVDIQLPDNLKNLDGFNLILTNSIEANENQESTFQARTRFLTDALRPEEKGNRFILDIDCYVSLNRTPDIEHIISLATQAHYILGDIFENLITDKTRALMEIEK